MQVGLASPYRMMPADPRTCIARLQNRRRPSAIYAADVQHDSEIPFQQKLQKRYRVPTVETCPDCEVHDGELHDLFCTKEQCPFCNGQLITCDCIREILSLSAEEIRSVEEYINDTVPPLSEIMERWLEALVAKGRIPFRPYPDDCLRAAYRGDTTTVKRFLSLGFDPNAGNEVGYTALMAAARGGSVDAIRFLLSHGADPTIADTRGYTALHWAVAQPATDGLREVACVQALVKRERIPTPAARTAPRR